MGLGHVPRLTDDVVPHGALVAGMVVQGMTQGAQLPPVRQQQGRRLRGEGPPVLVLGREPVERHLLPPPGPGQDPPQFGQVGGGQRIAIRVHQVIQLPETGEPRNQRLGLLSLHLPRGAEGGGRSSRSPGPGGPARKPRAPCGRGAGPVRAGSGREPRRSRSPPPRPGPSPSVRGGGGAPPLAGGRPSRAEAHCGLERRHAGAPSRAEPPEKGRRYRANRWTWGLGEESRGEGGPGGTRHRGSGVGTAGRGRKRGPDRPGAVDGSHPPGEGWPASPPRTGERKEGRREEEARVRWSPWPPTSASACSSPSPMSPPPTGTPSPGPGPPPSCATRGSRPWRRAAARRRRRGGSPST